MEKVTHVLFLCSRNQWRSPTAEKVFQKEQGIRVRSAGLSKKSRRKVSGRDVRWADIIFVMEHRHRYWLREGYAREMRGKKLVVLGIPDDYQYMDPELVMILQEKVQGYW